MQTSSSLVIGLGENKAAEGEAAKAHAELVARDRAAQAEWDAAAAAAKKRKSGRPPKQATGTSSRGPSLREEGHQEEEAKS